MAPLLDHSLLALSVVALGAAGLRAAAALGAAGLQRVLAALPIAATAAALCALALGLIDLGASPAALTVAAGAIWVSAARLLPPPRRSASAEMGAELAGLPIPWRVAVAALGGIVIALVTWLLRNPALAGDGLVYHAPIVAAWVSAGDPPSLHAVAQGTPLEAYPLTTELLATWAAGIARSFVPLSLWNPAMLVVLVLAGWSGLRSVGAPRPVAGLATSALATSPLLVAQLNTFTTDISALAWLVCCAALCAACVRVPGLLACAVLAAGLAIGTKTTATPLAAVCIVAATVAIRGRIRPLAGALAAAAVAAGIVGGLWYFRNLVLHGSPLWPFADAPWGDPIPALFDLSDDRLLFDPSSAQGRLDDYARALYGGLVLLGGGLVAALLVPARRVIAASAATALALLTWTIAPFTAFPPDAFFDALQAGAVRYLLPGIAAGALALALAASAAPRAAARVGLRHVAAALLGVALVANLVGDARLGFVGDYAPATALSVDPVLPSLLVPLLGAAAGVGALGGLAAVRSLRRPRWAQPRRLSLAALIAGPVIAGALLALAASGYVTRSTGLPPTPPGAAWLVRQPGYPDGDAPVAIQSRMIGTLAGDRLGHPLTLIGLNADCAGVREAAREGWVVISISGVPTEASPEAQGFARYATEVRAGELATAHCLAGLEPAYGDGQLRIYAPIDPGAG